MIPQQITPAQARAVLLRSANLCRNTLPRGAAGVRALLAGRRCIQLDPLDTIGTNADLVAAARVDGIRKGDVYRHLLCGQGFEHFAKERCILPAEAFPHYRAQAVQTPWWRHSERLKRLPEGVVEAVAEEVRQRGPLTTAELSDQGRVQALDWHGWKGTSKAATMAMEVLWLRCRVVVCGRRGRQKIYDIPERALPDQWDRAPTEDFGLWGIRERVKACGMLSTATGPWWSMLRAWRPLWKQLVAQGELALLALPDSRRTWLAAPDWADHPPAGFDQRLRILGPLDPLIWDRGLVERAFGFRYLWEVYKPAAQREWGWYVMPLLYRGRFVGRMEAHIEDGQVCVDRLWKEPGRFPNRAFEAALARHAKFVSTNSRA